MTFSDADVLVYGMSLWVILFLCRTANSRYRVVLDNSNNGPRKEKRFYKSPLSGGLVLLIIFFLDLGVLLVTGVLEEDLQCQSSAVYGSSISRISASVLWRDSGNKAFVYMFVSLSILSLIFLGEVEKIAKNRVVHYQHVEVPWERASFGERLTSFGFCMTILTAALPDEASNCFVVPVPTADCYRSTFISNLHLIGIAGGIVISTIGALIRLSFTEVIRPKSHLSKNKWEQYQIHSKYYNGCAILLFAVATTMYCATQFLFAEGTYDAPDMHICIIYTTKNMCEGQWLNDRNQELVDSLSGSWQCVWNSYASFAEKACTNPRCHEWLASNKRSIVYEMLTLLYWVLSIGWALGLVNDVEVDQHYGDPYLGLMIKDRLNKETHDLLAWGKRARQGCRLRFGVQQRGCRALRVSASPLTS